VTTVCMLGAVLVLLGCAEGCDDGYMEGNVDGAVRLVGGAERLEG
jgi:hypothetical protein